MTLALDAYDILRRIGSNPELFAGLRGAVAEVAEGLVKKELTSSSLEIESFRALVGALGEENVALILQALAPGDVLALARTIDPYHGKARSKDLAWAERHLMDLALGRSQPVSERAPGAKSRTKPSKPRSSVAARKRASPFGTGAMGAKSDD
jgi:hypothetical protein